MHSTLQRVQNSFGTLTSFMIVLASAISIVSYIQLQMSGASNLASTIAKIDPTLSFKISRSFGSNDGSQKENCRVNFDLDADLTPLFNWNTKQVFVYLTAEYSGKRDDISNKVVFWDKIITRKDDAVLQLRNKRGEYSVWDVEKTFRGRNATVKVEWNVQPHVGFLTYGELIPDGGVDSFIFAKPE